MRGLRRTAGAVAAALGALALGAALALLAGFLYAWVRGEPTGAMVAWILGLFFLAALLLGAFGATLPDEAAAAEAEAPAGEPVPAPADGVRSVDGGDEGEKAEEGEEGDWYDPLVFGLILVGLVAGGPFGIAGYEALKPTTGSTAPTAPAPAPAPGTTPSASASPSPSAAPSVTPGDAAVAWTVPATGGPYDTAPGAWAVGEAVVQIRSDGLSAYAVRDGAVRWNVPAPRREAVCATGREAVGNIGIVAFGRHRKPCAHLLAVHTSTGQVLWRQRAEGAGIPAYGLAVGGATVVVAEDRVVRGRAAETGEPRWQRPRDRGCAVRALDADDERVLLVEQCGAGARLVALETRTGEESWTTALPVESVVAAAVVSVTPAVVALNEEDPRGTHAVLAFDDRGTPRATIPVHGPAGTLALPDQVSETGRGGRAVVVGDRLIALAGQGSSAPHKVVALGLKDGRPAWEHAPEGGSVEALSPAPDGRIAVLAGGPGVVLLDATTGAPRGGTATKDPRAVVSLDPLLLLPATGAHVVLNRTPAPPAPALFALR
ncbi:PQQ-binding-like beta-propeller repeat protein [Streptomyces sp. NPDC085529]|uniref:outer membrane protein assembly factor BamB family protein n=1 Tax=Streptomyces sp. NPDC085529 TaxID=3365729 RepID=UPI0037D560D4